MFNQKKFRDILEKARNNRTNEEYARQSGVSRPYISAYMNLRRDDPPSPEVIKRLAEAAHNGVTYDDLMEAAGYITRNPDVIEEAIKDDPELERIWNMLNNREDVRLMFKKIADLKPLVAGSIPASPAI